MENGLRIGPFLLAAMVVGASALQGSFAADKGSTASTPGPRSVREMRRGIWSDGGRFRPVRPNALGPTQSACLPVIMRAFQDATADLTE